MCGEGGADTDEEGLGLGLPSEDEIALAVVTCCGLQALLLAGHYEHNQQSGSLRGSLTRHWFLFRHILTTSSKGQFELRRW